MAIDIDAAINTAYSMENDISEMVLILRIFQDGKVNVKEIGDINFSAGQKQTLEDKYNTLKTNLQTLYSQLP